MSVSVNVQFSGNVDGKKHRAVIAGMVAAMEAVLVAEGVKPGTFSMWESETVTRGRSFPDGQFSDFNMNYPSRMVNVSTGFHVNEDPIVQDSSSTPEQSGTDTPVAPEAPAEVPTATTTEAVPQNQDESQAPQQ